MKILHITAHLGGGVGKALSSLVINDKENTHVILCLEMTQNRKFFDICKACGVPIYIVDNVPISQLLSDADIVQVEWWHHPSVCAFMVQYLSEIKTRLVIWSHISGCTYPRIPFAFIDLADKFVFTTAYSYENPSFSSKEQDIVKKTATIIGSGTVE